MHSVLVFKVKSLLWLQTLLLIQNTFVYQSPNSQMALYWTHLKSVTLSEYEYITADMFSLSIDSYTTHIVRISRGSGRQGITKLPKNSHQSKEIPHPALISRHSLYLSLSLMIKAIRHKHNTINNFSGGSRQTLHNNVDLWEHCCWSDSAGLVSSSERLYSAVAHWPLAPGINIYKSPRRETAFIKTPLISHSRHTLDTERQ